MWVKNDSGGQKTWVGQVVADQAYYEIEAIELAAWANNSLVLADIGSGDAIIASDDSGNTDITDVAQAINRLKGLQPADADGNPVYHTPPFAAKKLPCGKKLYKRLHGKIFSLDAGSNDCIFTVPYAHVKMIGARIINGEMGDTCDMMVLDDVSGTYSTVPNYMLNQYGFDAVIDPQGHVETCKYDADLYVGMQVKFVYNSVTAKDIGINYDISEVKA